MNICYKDMVLRAREKGDNSEETMIKSVEHVDSLLSAIKEAHPTLYWQFIRSEQENMFGNHYSEEFAIMDVSKLSHVNSNGEIIRGEYWSMAQVDKVAKENGLDYVADLYVALNLTYHDKINMEIKWMKDHCRMVDEDEIEEKALKHIILDAINFWFKDKDIPDGKIWIYMNSLKSKLLM